MAVLGYRQNEEVEEARIQRERQENGTESSRDKTHTVRDEQRSLHSYLPVPIPGRAA